ncbi:metallophosphoesterase family protein [Paenibacillus sp. GSMTC-2017]|uniref:metallophosphoesterase family protein n=1 Tax=Paenibacillus sp. GSMTC-2017 TaxID=2794350 RepID=UPI0018D67F38|nr:metallophosphoesterase family protein [Paenibacillus sp. GSMTC-2017]MBH5316525.1 metallophosphoesterase family protein [Paenibacillus sp. GSMTC-2017]
MEKIAVISDIHGNKFALEAVLANIILRNVDHIVQLGDALYGPLDPLGTADLLMNRNIIHIMGNCDEILLVDEVGGLTFNFVKPLITPVYTEWLGKFLRSWSYKDLLFCHGTPTVNNRYLLEEVMETGSTIKSPAKLEQELAEISEQIILCGHSHVGRSVYLPNGKLIVNAGSVGLPAYEDELPIPHKMEAGSPHARYVLLEGTEGKWTISHVQVPYDWTEAARLARSNGREDYAVAIEKGYM